MNIILAKSAGFCFGVKTAQGLPNAGIYGILFSKGV